MFNLSRNDKKKSDVHRVDKENVFKETEKKKKKSGFMLWFSERRGRGGNSN